MQKFDLQQRNNLLTGNALAMEISSISTERRAFITICGYLREGNERKAVSKILNQNKDDVLFYIRKYELDKHYIENDLDVSEEEMAYSIWIEDIEGIDKLEKELAKHIDDFSKLDSDWKLDFLV